tara:strand:+ start:759 stop:965 length:207 start_codon:yes stop_codon:yes gene_type:complete
LHSTVRADGSRGALLFSAAGRGDPRSAVFSTPVGACHDDRQLTDEMRKQGYTEEDVKKDKAIVLWPTN